MAELSLKVTKNRVTFTLLINNITLSETFDRQDIDGVNRWRRKEAKDIVERIPSMYQNGELGKYLLAHKDDLDPFAFAEFFHKYAAVVEKKLT